MFSGFGVEGLGLAPPFLTIDSWIMDLFVLWG